MKQKQNESYWRERFPKAVRGFFKTFEHMWIYFVTLLLAVVAYDATKDGWLSLAIILVGVVVNMIYNDYEFWREHKAITPLTFGLLLIIFTIAVAVLLYVWLTSFMQNWR